MLCPAKRRRRPGARSAEGFIVLPFGEDVRDSAHHELYVGQFGLDLLQVTPGDLDIRAAKIFLKTM